jgi:prepilin-type N-terminal cleavage/methylation domain-containing protein
MKRQQQSGYSLVEVLIALAITSIVLLTVVTLFYMGRRNVYSGKQMTYAVSVGTRILEDLSSLTSQDVGSSFNITDTTATGTPRATRAAAPEAVRLWFIPAQTIRTAISPPGMA